MTLPQGQFGAIMCDPPWRFNSLWGGRPKKVGGNYPSRAIDAHYPTMTIPEICALPVSDVAAPNCVLFMWISWTILPEALQVIENWGFKYKTCGFCWMKAHARKVDLFADDIEPRMGLGYWTRANSEVCLLATKGKPKRLKADVRQGIIEPAREHSRKPDGIHARVERLVAGPYLELFARTERSGWTCWGNEVGKFTSPAAA